MMNRFLVGAKGDKVVILRAAVGELSKEDAVNLAAWLLVVARTTPEERAAALLEIEGEP